MEQKPVDERGATPIPENATPKYFRQLETMRRQTESSLTKMFKEYDFTEVFKELTNKKKTKIKIPLIPEGGKWNT